MIIIIGIVAVVAAVFGLGCGLVTYLFGGSARCSDDTHRWMVRHEGEWPEPGEPCDCGLTRYPELKELP